MKQPPGAHACATERTGVFIIEESPRSVKWVGGCQPYTKGQYGGIVVDFDDKLVYTDRNGEPVRTLTVVTDDRWLNNDIIEQMMELEKKGVSYAAQQGILEDLFPEGSAFFTVHENGAGTRQNQRQRTMETYHSQVRKGNRTDLSDAETSASEPGYPNEHAVFPSKQPT